MRRILFLAALAAALSLNLAPPIPAAAGSFNGVCTAVAGASSGKRFATVKCYKETEPGDFSIRSTVWEHQDAKAYRDMARLSGARFTCTMSVTGSKTIDDQVYDSLKFSDCRSGAPARSAKPAGRNAAADQLVGPKPKTECYICQNEGISRAQGPTTKACIGKGQTFISLKGCRKL